MFEPDTNLIYLGDNGRAYCGAHLGASARFTGFDISGQEIMPVTPEIALEARRMGFSIACEDCGKVASLVHLPKKRYEPPQLRRIA